MQKIIGVTDLQRRLKAGLDEVTEEHEHQEGEVLRRFGRLRSRMAKASAGLSEEEVATEVEAARAELEA